MKQLAIFFCCLLLALLGCNNQPQTADSQQQTELVNVKGVVVAPLAEAYLYIYKEGMDLYGPAFARSQATGSDGAFELNLPAGDYIAVARKRQAGETAGPVLTGDHRSEFMQLKVRAGMAELSLLAPEKIGDERRLSAVTEDETTGLEGRITDADGNPVADARVQVYDHVQMSERPKYVSSKTDPDGRYRILLPEGGTYYLCARNKFGGPPKLGDLYGRYDQGTIEPSAVVVRRGELVKNIDITVNKVW